MMANPTDWPYFILQKMVTVIMGIIFVRKCDTGNHVCIENECLLIVINAQPFLSELERKTFAEYGFEDPQRRKGAEMSRFCIFYHFSFNIQQMSNPKTLKEPYFPLHGSKTLNPKPEGRKKKPEGRMNSTQSIEKRKKISPKHTHTENIQI